MKKEDLRTAYNEPSDGFHHSVMNALYHLDDKKSAKHRSGRRVMKVALVCALIAAVGTTTVAASTGFFGLFAKPVGKYGVNITAESQTSLQSSDLEETENYQIVRDISIHTAYVPEGFVANEYNGQTYGYYEDNVFSDSWYFMFFAYDSETYNRTEGSVIENEETEFNGHSAVISKKKLSENSDHIEYVVTEKFDDEKIVLRCVFSGEAYNKKYFEPDRNEILRIMEGVSITRTEVPESQTDGGYSYAPIADTYSSDLLKSGKARPGKLGETFKATVADYESEEVSLDIKVVSVSDVKNDEGLDRDEFYSAGPKINLHDKYFDKDGNLISEVKVEEPLEYGDGIDKLNKTVSKTYHRHIYNVKIEITADKDIKDLYRVFGLDGFGYSDEGKAYKSGSKGNVEEIGFTGCNAESFPLEKGQTKVISCLIYADEETGNDPCIGITTANGNTDEVVMTYVRLK